MTQGQMLTNEQKSLFQQRMERIADMATTEVAMSALKAKDLKTLFSALANRPRASRRFAGQLAAAVKSRLF